LQQLAPIAWCSDASFVCNDKLIGAWTFVTETTTPEDSAGHGTHTASTAAGNIITATLPAPTLTITDTISGVAPHANIVAYDVCIDTCPSNALLSAINQAVTDGVDVVNYSISGADNPWLDSIEQAFLSAFNAGVFISASAGNSGPGLGTTAHTAPWIMSVAASTHNRASPQNLINMSGGATTPPADMTGAGFTAGYGQAPIVYAGDFGDALCLSPFAASTWTNGEIVVCDRGTIARTEKGTNVLAGGAAGLVLANLDADGEDIVGDAHFLPAIHIGDTNGDILRTWLASGTGHMATLSGATTSYAASNGDIMAGFSSRGPSAFELMVPNITGPGVNVWAAVADGTGFGTPEFDFFSGTSMSSPHNAGAGALMIALNPTWSPAEIKSALMTTAYNGPTMFDEDGTTPVDPHDVGSGRINLTDAAFAGLVLDETGANFNAANPNSGGDPKTLNIASMTNTNCVDTCSWTRVVKSPLSGSASWDVSFDAPAGMIVTVTPDSFALGAGATQSLLIEVDVTGISPGVWTFANVILTNTGGTRGAAYPEAHLPITLIPDATFAPDIDVSASSVSSTQLTNDIEVKNLGIDNTGNASLTWSIFEDGATSRGIGWSEDWDSYGTGVSVHGLGGWKGWENVPGNASSTSTVQDLSAPNSIRVVNQDDLVREFSGYTSGIWEFSTQVYVPSGLSGQSYFILLNAYDDSGATNNWSTQVYFDGTSDLLVEDMNDTGGPGTLPIIPNQWVELLVVINLNADTQAIYYDGDLLTTASWSGGSSGGGATTLGAIDLWGNGASEVFYDDLSLIEVLTCDGSSDIPWLSVSPAAGSTPAMSEDDVDLTFDSTGLSDGTYDAYICISSNDPDEPLVEVFVELIVTAVLPDYYLYLPIVAEQP
jgi:hypothetical protein